MTPTTPTGPFSIDVPADPTTMFLNDVMTIPASLAGLPAVSIPAATTAQQPKLPLGLQLIANSKNEDVLLRAAHALEAKAELGRCSIYR